ncbi:MAG: hypothetical protein WC642_16080 [Nocardioides sp.]|jgi:hypothetical protein
MSEQEAVKPAATRDDLRKATLGTTHAPKKDSVEFNGADLEVRLPSITVRDEISDSAKDKDGKWRQARWNASAAIHCTFIPGTTQKVFEPSDLPVLLEVPAGSYVDQIAMKVQALLFSAADADSKK